MHILYKNNFINFSNNFYIKKNLNKILPTNKNQSMSMERLFGIVLQQEGYDLSNSVQGDHFYSEMNTHNFKKKIFNRR